MAKKIKDKKPKKVPDFIRELYEGWDELTLRAHSGWVSGADVLSEADFFETAEHKELNKRTGPSYYLPFFNRGMPIVSDRGDYFWGVRWSDAYEFIREFKGAEAAAKFIENRLDIASAEAVQDGWTGIGIRGKRRPRVAFDQPPVKDLEIVEKLAGLVPLVSTVEHFASKRGLAGKISREQIEKTAEDQGFYYVEDGGGIWCSLEHALDVEALVAWEHLG